MRLEQARRKMDNVIKEGGKKRKRKVGSKKFLERRNGI